MLAVMLLVVRMCVTCLTQGKGDPPAWMMWMYCAHYAKTLMTVIFLVISSPNGEVIDVDQKDW